MTRLKAFFGAALYACAACAGAQVLPSQDPHGQQFPARVPKGGVAPILDMRIQDDGIALPKGVQQQQDGEPAKPEAKPAAAPAPRASERPAPPSPPR